MRSITDMFLDIISPNLYEQKRPREKCGHDADQPLSPTTGTGARGVHAGLNKLHLDQLTMCPRVKLGHLY